MLKLLKLFGMLLAVGVFALLFGVALNPDGAMGHILRHATGWGY